MKLANFKIDQLKVLPLRAIVAFAARCSRRVRHLAQLPDGDRRRDSRREAVGYALSMAEGFAGGSDAPLDESFIAKADAIMDAGSAADSAAVSAVAQTAHAAASAWHVPRSGRRVKHPGPEGLPARFARVTADIAAMSTPFTAAADAFHSVGHHNHEIVHAAMADYHKLVGLKLGSYPEVGTPVDPSPGGPLGPL